MAKKEQKKEETELEEKEEIEKNSKLTESDIVDIQLDKMDMEKELLIAQAGAFGIKIEISEGALIMLINMLRERDLSENLKSNQLLDILNTVGSQLGPFLQQLINKKDAETKEKKEE
jgi:hypothetical protein